MVWAVSKPPDRLDSELLALAGALAGGVAQELSRPIRELREMLAVIVDNLDHHVATAKGPTPYPWKQVGELRDRVADAYLVSRKVARLAGDLASVAGSGAPVASAVDVNKTIEAALNLARHRLSSGTEVFIDFGAIPSVRAVPATLMLAIAQLIVQAAEAVGDEPYASLSLRSRRGEDAVTIYVVDNAPADDEVLRRRIGQVERTAAAAGATVHGTLSEEGGAELCLRIPVGH